MERERLRIAVQKSGRLAEKSTRLFSKCGLDFDIRKDRLVLHSMEFSVDLLLVRDDDIPGYVADGVCDLGIVGENILREKFWSRSDEEARRIAKVMNLEFGFCRLSIAVSDREDYSDVSSLSAEKI